MRVGLLTTSFPRFRGDVAGHFVLGFAQALAALGHSVEVLAPEPAEPVQLPVFDGIELRWLPYLRPRGWQRTFYGAGVPDNLRADPRAWLGPLPFSAALARVMLRRRDRWDAVVSHFGVPCGIVGGALRGGRPHLCVQHSADLHALRTLPGGTHLARMLAAGSTALWFVTAKARDEFLQLVPASARADAGARCVVQAMGVATPSAPSAERGQLRARLGIERYALLTLARLVPVKGLVEAARALAGRRDLEWLIGGDGPERAQLEAIARSASLRLRLLGTVGDADKADLLHAADAFLLPSRVLRSGRSEGAPTALLEAMAAGLPVIASDVGGIVEVLAAGARGWLFDPAADIPLPAVIDRMRAAAPHEREARVHAAREFALSQTWAALAPRIEAYLRPTSSDASRATAPRDCEDDERDGELRSDQPERTSAVFADD